jgi:hypothetical protein
MNVLGVQNACHPKVPTRQALWRELAPLGIRDMHTHMAAERVEEMHVDGNPSELLIRDLLGGPIQHSVADVISVDKCIAPESGGQPRLTEKSARAFDESAI